MRSDVAALLGKAKISIPEQKDFKQKYSLDDKITVIPLEELSNLFYSRQPKFR